MPAVGYHCGVDNNGSSSDENGSCQVNVPQKYLKFRKTKYQVNANRGYFIMAQVSKINEVNAIRAALTKNGSSVPEV